MSAAVDVGRQVIASTQVKMVASLTRDIKCSFDSAAEIVEEVRINIPRFISPLELSGLPGGVGGGRCRPPST